MTFDHRRSANDAAAYTSATRSIDDLDAAIRGVAGEMDSRRYRMLMLVREFDDRMGWQKWGMRNCAEWLAWRCDLSLSAAREHVRTAHALREMPAIAAAFEDGRLSYSKVRALTRVVEYRDEDALLAYALEVSAEQLEERCREIRNASPEQSVGGAWRSWEHRSLIVSRDPARGMLKITVELPIADGEVVVNALERAADDGDAAIGLEFSSVRKLDRVRDAADDPHAANGWRAQRADALLAIMKASLAGAAASRTSAPGDCVQHDSAAGNSEPCGASSACVADHYQLVVHVDEAALRGGLGRSDLPIDTVKRLACDGSVVVVTEDDHGTPLAVSRKQRLVSTPLKRALWSRDRGCTFPGCPNRRYIDAHHIRHWADGGETSLENLTLLCSHHHRALHEGRFAIRRDTLGAIYFQRADGRVIPKGGYRLNDMLDDDVEAGDAATFDPMPSAEGYPVRPDGVGEPSAEGYALPPYISGGPSAEVRESEAIYLIRRDATAVTHVHRQ
jgi:hypothetical protein